MHPFFIFLAIGLGLELGRFIVQQLRAGWQRFNQVAEDLANEPETIEVRWSVRP